jgi:hypothetical protein
MKLQRLLAFRGAHWRSRILNESKGMSGLNNGDIIARDDPAQRDWPGKADFLLHSHSSSLTLI